ncbi:hypothetical protein ACIBI9_51190 [Nonomuraea sp. NPDC050451]|uniref:hypothetical protein n=1 Tax=Nonomuraea sp. NPDC050451 TaxID=3364364 RepID=UPI0037A86884
MGEFVGIDPGRADQLIQQMEASKRVLGSTRPGLEAAIAEAGEAWTGWQGATAMHRSWAFFDESQRDLKWRIDTIRRMVPSGAKGLVTAFFVFANEPEAAQRGKGDAAAIAEVLKRHNVENTVESWRKVADALAATGDKVDDPAYAAALLEALGPDGFRAVFMHWMKDKGPAAMQKGVPPGTLEQAQGSLGQLARAYSSAEGAGRLGEEWRGKLVETTEPSVLASLVALAMQSDTFLNQVATQLLGRPLGAESSAGQKWNLNALVEAYDANPQALQRLLAENKQVSDWLLHPGRFRTTGISGFEERLAGVLDKALKPGVGVTDLRDRAWLNLINSLGAENTPWIGGQWGTFKDSPVGRSLAENVSPYLDQLARGQAKLSSPDLVALHPAPPWDKLDPGVASRFMGALMQDKAAASTLMKGSHDYTVGLDIGRFRPFGDESTQAEYTSRTALAGGLANLVVSGSTHAEWSDDEYAEWLADTMTLPIDWLSNKYWSINDPTTATARDKGLDDTKNVFKDMITGYFDEKTPENARKVADQVATQQARLVFESLEQHGQKPLSIYQQDEVRMAFRGRLYNALIDALEKRGG